MRLSSQNNQFIFNLPVDFIEEYLYRDFKKLMDKNFVAYDSVIDYVNSTIKEISFPSFTLDNPEQRLKYGKKYSWREAQNVQDKFSNDLDITFRSVDSHLNYFILLQVLIESYLNPKKTHLPLFLLHVLNKNGDLIYTVSFRDVLLKNISSISLAYQIQEVQEITFTITFRFNWIDIFWEIDDDDVATSTSIYDIPINFQQGTLDKAFGNNPYPRGGERRPDLISYIKEQGDVNS